MLLRETHQAFCLVVRVERSVLGKIASLRHPRVETVANLRARDAVGGVVGCSSSTGIYSGRTSPSVKHTRYVVSELANTTFEIPSFTAA